MPFHKTLRMAEGKRVFFVCGFFVRFFKDPKGLNHFAKAKYAEQNDVKSPETRTEYGVGMVRLKVTRKVRLMVRLTLSE